MTGSQTIRTTQPLPRLVDLVAYDAVGVGHIKAGKHETRHPCGEPTRAERFRWPAKVPCADCVGAPATESEQRAMWGDR